MYANDADQLVSKINNALAVFFLKTKWTYSLKRVEQVKQEPTVQKRFLFFKSTQQPTQVLFQVTVEVFSNGLSNSLVNMKSLEKP